MNPLHRPNGRVLLLSAALLAACSGKEGSKAPPKPKLQFPVETAPVVVRKVEYAVTAVGSVEAFEKVQVTARVGGVVEAVRFREGDEVAPGTVLAEIEPARYQIAVDAAKATFQKAEASRADAEAGLARREGVVARQPGLIPGEEIETWRTRVRTGAADVAQSKSALAQAELNLKDAFVRAPVAGRIQTRTIQTGQYVQPGAVLATLVRRDPLLLRFQVPEADSARMKTGMTTRFSVAGEGRPFSARITSVADAADLQSRMIAVTAEVDDPERSRLRPGAFAEVTVPIASGARETPVIRQTAIRPSEKGFLVFVVEGETARERIVTLGLRTADGLVEVAQGLKAGDVLVVRGAEALRDGVPVKVSAGSAAVPGEGAAK